MFPSHVFALLLVREANNALTLGKVLGYVRKNPELSMQLACRSCSTRECFVCGSSLNVSLVFFATKCGVAQNVFPRPGARRARTSARSGRAQGYFMSRPLPAKELEEWLKHSM
jgi:hypothetical protein